MPPFRMHSSTPARSPTSDGGAIKGCVLRHTLISAASVGKPLHRARQSVGQTSRYGPSEEARKLAIVPASPIGTAIESIPSARLSNRMASALCVLSARATSRDAGGLWTKSLRYASLRACQGGFGSVQASVQSATISATASPKMARISANVSAPPLSSAASCNRPAMA
jgi:hypothetical protein